MPSVQLAPAQVVVALSVEFDDALKVPAIETAVERIEDRLRLTHPQVAGVFLERQIVEGYRLAYERRFGRQPAPG